MKIDKDTITFSSGQTRYANNGIIGLGDFNAEYGESVRHGYDGSIDIDDSYGGEPLTRADIIELADFMIARWTAFKERATAKPD